MHRMHFLSQSGEDRYMRANFTVSQVTLVTTETPSVTTDDGGGITVGQIAGLAVGGAVIVILLFLIAVIIIVLWYNIFIL